MPNIDDPVFDEPREQPGFRALRARLSRQAGSERIGLSLPQGGGLFSMFRSADAVDYYDGEQPPATRDE